MIEIHKTDEYEQWFMKLKDRTARARINARIKRASLGNLGDIKALGNGVSEMRIMYGPGYRIYLTQKDAELIILLAGGDKSTQTDDIAKAKRIVLEL